MVVPLRLSVASMIATLAFAHIASSADIPPALSFVIGASCNRAAAGIIERSDLRPALGDRAVDVSAVCACTEASIAKDARAVEFFSVPLSVLQERMQNEKAKSYVTLRITTSLLACLAPEFEKSLEAGPPAD